MVEVSEGGEYRLTCDKEYQTLFWVPMLYQTAKHAQNLVDEMLGMITTFYDNDSSIACRRSLLVTQAIRSRRKQILGDQLDTEVVTTRVEVVPKSDSTKYTILNILKVRLFTLALYHLV